MRRLGFEQHLQGARPRRFREGVHAARERVPCLHEIGHGERARGTIVLKSTYAGEAPVNLSSVVVDEITLVGSRCGAFAPALELLAARALPVRDLVQARYPLARGTDAFAEAARPGALKVLLEA